jgi:hypothetical protein
MKDNELLAHQKSVSTESFLPSPLGEERGEGAKHSDRNRSFYSEHGIPACMSAMGF